MTNWEIRENVLKKLRAKNTILIDKLDDLAEKRQLNSLLQKVEDKIA